MKTSAVASLLALSSRQDLARSAESRAAVTLLAQAVAAMAHDALLARLAHAGSSVTADHLAAFSALQCRLSTDTAASLTAQDAALLKHLQDNLTGIPTAGPQPGAATITALIVEDEPQVREHLSRASGRYGAVALTAATGAEAIAVFSQKRPDVVLLDVSLPDMNGLEVLAGIKQIDPAPPVYFVTGVSGDAFMDEAARLGAAGCLPKPVDLAALARLFRAHARRG